MRRPGTTPFLRAFVLIFLLLLLAMQLQLPAFSPQYLSGMSAKSYVVLLSPWSSGFANSNEFERSLAAAGVNVLGAKLFSALGVGGVFNLTQSELDIVEANFHPYLLLQNQVISADAGVNLSSAGPENWSYFPGGPYTGEGVKVAVIDTGVDTNSSLLGPSFASHIVGGYDFVNQRSFPVDTDGHGTSVASIIAANSTSFVGVSPGVQLLVYKVFKGNVTTSDLLVEALDRAASDGASIINLSLGGGLDVSMLWQLGYLLSQRGIELVAATGNGGPDIGTVSVPANLPGYIAVGASTSRYTSQPQAFLELGEGDWLDTAQSMQGSPTTPSPVNATYVYVKSATPAELVGVNLTGKIAVTLRDHKTTFANMERNVSAAGAVGLVVVNNENTSFLGTLEVPNATTYTPTIPVVSVSYTDGYRLLNADRAGEEIVLEVFVPTSPYPASFSSRGPVGPFSLKPEITAPGDSVPVVSLQGMALESGTSFSAPQVTGALALLKQEHPGLKPDQYYSILELSAYKMEKLGIEFPPYVQGAGELNISKALQTPFTVSPGDFVALYPYPEGSYSQTLNLTFFTNATFSVSYNGSYPILISTSVINQTRATLTVTAPPGKPNVTYDELVFRVNGSYYSYPVLVVGSEVGVLYNSTDGTLHLSDSNTTNGSALVTYPDGSVHDLLLGSNGTTNLVKGVGTPLPGFYSVQVETGNGNTTTMGLGMFYVGQVLTDSFPFYVVETTAAYSVFVCLVAFALLIERRAMRRRTPSAVFPSDVPASSQAGV